MVILAAGFGLYVDRGSSLAFDGSVVSVGQDTKLLHGIHGRDERDVAPGLRIGHAVQEVVIGIDVIAATVRLEL